MKNKIQLKCPECAYVFLIESNYIADEGRKIECPYCKIERNSSFFEEYQPEESPVIKEGIKKLHKLLKGAELEKVPNTGYRLSIDHFKGILKDANRNSVKEFFENEVKIYLAHYKNGAYIFTDSCENEVSIDKVHDYIQNDVVLQRKFYNWWMGLYH